MADYDIDGLKNGIVCAQKNISALKQAIQKERHTIKDYEKMIRALEEKRELQRAIKSIEIVRE